MFCSEAWKAWTFDACSAERHDEGDTFGIVAAQSGLPIWQVDLFEALIGGPSMDQSALYSYQPDE
jgi:hypothetical protein